MARMLDSSRVLLAAAVPAGDIALMRQAAALLERGLTVAPNDPWLLHTLGYAYYRQATISLGRDGANIGDLLDRADSLLERSTKITEIAESHALRAGVIGMMIAGNPLKGIYLGPKSNDQMERALALGPKNPRVWLLRGIGAVNTPEMFGGGLDRAEKHLATAIELYASDRPAAPAPAWGAHEAHIWLGQVYAKQDRNELARAQYQKALALEPRDQWTRMSLLPALDRK